MAKGTLAASRNKLATTTAPVAPKSNYRADATVLAALISEATVSDAEFILDSEEEAVRGPLVIAADIAADVGDKLGEFPKVGSYEYNDDGTKTGLGNPDYVRVTKPTANGGTRHSNVSWFDDFAEKTMLGVSLNALIDDLKEKKKDNLRADWDEVSDSLNTAEGRMRKWKNKVRRAIDWLQQSAAFAKLPHVKFYLAMVKDDNGNMVPSRSPKPIKIWGTRPEDKDVRFISLTNFLSFDVAIAIDNGGTWDALLATVAQDPDEEKNGQVAPLPFKDLFLTMSRLNALMEQDNMDKIILQEAAKKETGKIFAHELVEYHLRLGRVVASLMPYYELVEKEADDADAAARAALVKTGATG